MIIFSFFIRIYGITNIIIAAKKENVVFLKTEAKKLATATVVEQKKVFF